MSEIILDAGEKSPVQNISNNTEKAVIGIALVGTLFKLQHWPGASILLVVGLSSLAMLYFPLGFYFLTNKSEKIVATVSGMFLSFVPLGIMFKVQHWPGASAMLTIAMITVPLVYLALFFMRKKAQPDSLPFYNSMLLRTTFLILILFILAMVRMH
ncbi:MAG: hypothetical protein AB7G44_10135 [Bacteroidia bacterium]